MEPFVNPQVPGIISDAKDKSGRLDERHRFRRCLLKFESKRETIGAVVQALKAWTIGKPASSPRS
jgi:hypothetical protein